MSTELTKPINCTCRYPQVVARNMNGHDETCPVYVEWAEALNVKRGKAHASIVALGVCPACEEYGVPAESNRPYKFCLKCGWAESPSAAEAAG